MLLRRKQFTEPVPVTEPILCDGTRSVSGHCMRIPYRIRQPFLRIDPRTRPPGIAYRGHSRRFPSPKKTLSELPLHLHQDE